MAPHRCRATARTGAVGCALTVAIAVVAGCSGHSTTDSTKASTTHPTTPVPTPATGPVNVNGDLFVPNPAASTQATLTAQQAYADYSRGRRLPARTIAQYGTLTAGGEDHVKVWAYSSNGGCWSGYGPTPLPVPPDGYCTTWTFLDPDSGQMLESTQQN